MIADALILAGATGSGFYLIYSQLPLKLKLWIQNHKLFTRIVCAVGVYTLLGGSVTALFAAAFLDLFVGTLLSILKDDQANANLQRLGAYLRDLRGKIAHWMTEMCAALPVPKQTTATIHQPVAQA